MHVDRSFCSLVQRSSDAAWRNNASLPVVISADEPRHQTPTHARTHARLEFHCGRLESECCAARGLTAVKLAGNDISWAGDWCITCNRRVICCERFQQLPLSFIRYPDKKSRDKRPLRAWTPPPPPGQKATNQIFVLCHTLYQKMGTQILWPHFRNVAQ